LIAIFNPASLLADRSGSGGIVQGEVGTKRA